MSYSLNDPQLQAIEAHIAATPPQVSTAQQQRLLYRCAFAAGRSSTRRALRRWQAAAGALAVVLAGMTVALFGRPPSSANIGAANVANDPLPTEPRRSDPELSPPERRPAREISLDAWQVPRRADTSFDSELAQFVKNDPQVRSLAVGSLTRRILEE